MGIEWCCKAATRRFFGHGFDSQQRFVPISKVAQFHRPVSTAMLRLGSESTAFACLGIEFDGKPGPDIASAAASGTALHASHRSQASTTKGFRARNGA